MKSWRLRRWPRRSRGFDPATICRVLEKARLISGFHLEKILGPCYLLVMPVAAFCPRVKAVKPLFAVLLPVLLLLSPTLAAEPVRVTGVRVTQAPDKTRLVLALSAKVTPQIFLLAGPDRLVIDLADARLAAKLPKPAGDDPNLNGLRSGARAGDDLRIVLDLKRPVGIKS